MAGKNKVLGWVEHPSPRQLKQGSGWFGELSRVLVSKDRQFVVMIRDVKTELGIVEHACLRNATETDIPWAEKQRIKNEIFGDERTAIEVFPQTSELVDHAMMYHIWVLPDNIKLPFGID